MVWATPGSLTPSIVVLDKSLNFRNGMGWKRIGTKEGKGKDGHGHLKVIGILSRSFVSLGYTTECKISVYSR